MPRQAPLTHVNGGVPLREVNLTSRARLTLSTAPP